MLYLVTTPATTEAPVTKVYESAADTARHIRKALKSAFPGVTFSVRSKNYSMGCSVSVSWEDAPIRRQVEALVKQFESSTFDGMTDSTTTHGYMRDGIRRVGADYVFA